MKDLLTKFVALCSFELFQSFSLTPYTLQEIV